MTTRNYQTEVNATLSRPMDRAHMKFEVEDPAIRTDLEGGYVATRPRFKRKPRRTWSFGYTDINNEDKRKIEDFWDAMHGGSQKFYWQDRYEYESELWRRDNDPEHPLYASQNKPALATDAFTYLVRFKEKPDFRPAGYGMNLRWNVPTITVEQV